MIDKFIKKNCEVASKNTHVMFQAHIFIFVCMKFNFPLGVLTTSSLLMLKMCLVAFYNYFLTALVREVRYTGNNFPTASQEVHA